MRYLLCCCWVFTVMFLALGAQAQETQPNAEPADTTAPADPASADPTEAGDPPAEDEPITTGEAFLLKLKQGGLTMVFLLLASIVAVAYTIERFVNQRKSRIVPDDLIDEADRLWAAGDFDGLTQLARKSDSTLGRMLLALVRHRRHGVSEASIIAGDVAARDLKRHLQRAYPLAVVATISPLLGLFGTVIGMIGAFDQIAAMGELANPSAFGGDIGKALVTTGAGLAIAIPALALYHWFKSRVNLYGIELEEQVSELISDRLAHPTPASAPALPTPAPERSEGRDMKPKEPTHAD